MAKIIGPLYSFGASGTLANVVTYLAGSRMQTAKRCSRPAPAASAAQLARRKKYRRACLNWHITTVQTDYDWLTIGAARRITAFNAYISDCMAGRILVVGSIWDNGATEWDNTATYWDQL